MFIRRILNRLSRAKGQWRIYLLEVLLIILSVLLAIQADRYNQKRKNNDKRETYVQALLQDLQDEQFSNRNNLEDCKKDIADLEACMRLCRYDQNDSLDTALDRLRKVFSRGVFRSFPPTTFDIMTYSGDISLIEDLALRKKLAATFAFRDTYLKNDLQDFDEKTIEVSRQMDVYLDFSCMAKTNKLHQCIIDRQGFIEDTHNELFLFLQTAKNRAFHLEIALDSFERTISALSEYQKR